MPQYEFYNLNERRKYPFVFPVSGELDLSTPPAGPGPFVTDEVILDAGFILGPKALFEADDQVQLESVLRSGDNLTFTFTATSSGIGSSRFVFVRDKDAPYGATDFVECGDDPLMGIGHLVTGELAAFWATLTNGVTYTVFSLTPIVVEPALVVSQKGHMVQTINVGNIRRASAVRCCAPDPGFDDDVISVAEQLVGAVKFEEGYNMNVYADAVGKAITFVPIVGAGKGEPCAQIFPGSDNAPLCGDLILTMNGVGASESGAFQMLGGIGLFVDTYPAQHKIVIRGEFDTQLICTE